ncbi:ras-like protein [Anaeramoeba ignava]|uniref:Ras-like protein n=1 Tax=Anaeramoeba ignava TaxID=1746090 RepID=A0A9Q0LDL9_ANAIG|nr:ras-like protein [Anaeramoeba ignava]
MSHQNYFEYKILLIGDGGVGKKSIISQYVMNTFMEDYDPYYFDEEFRKQIMVDEEIYILSIYPTSLNEEWAAMTDSMIRSANAFILVYSINSRESFNHLQNYIDRIKQVKDSDVIDILGIVGAKQDLESQREVATQEARIFSEAHLALFLECSAKNEINITKHF